MVDKMVNKVVNKIEFAMHPKTILEAIFFKGSAIYKMREEVDFRLGVVAMLISSFLLSIPTDFVTFSLISWGMNFFTVFVGLFITLTIIFGFIKIMKGDIRYEEFLGAASFVLAASLVVVSFPILLIFEFVIGVKILSMVLFSLVPYYNFVIFGYACEVISYSEKHLSLRRVAIALFSMTMIFLFYYLLAFITT